MQAVPMQTVDPSRQAYGYAAAGYAQPQYGFPATTAFYGQYQQFQAQAQPFGRGVGGAGGARGGAGRGGAYPQVASYGRGGGYAQYGQAPMAFQGGFGRGGMMFGMRPRRKKPFVGGSLETQRSWEQQTLCCFFVQGLCKFGEGCRFSHADDGNRPCQFGSQCRVGHSGRGDPGPQPTSDKPQN